METNFLEGRTAVITGGSRGLGKAIALELAGAGARLALVARASAALEAAAAEIRGGGAEVEVYPTDVTDERQVRQLERDVLARFGRVDILVNNAGVNVRCLVEEFTLEDWNRVIATNLTGAFLLCRSFVPQMKGRGYGRILNMASMMSHVSLPGRAAWMMPSVTTSPSIAWCGAYLSGSTWASIPGQVKTPSAPAANGPNEVTFPSVTTSQIRVVFTPQPGKYVGVTELESWYPR